MAVKIDGIYRIIDEMAPFADACDWDNSGMLLRVSETTENILVTLDVTDETVSQAIEKKCGLIVAHHPVLFNGTKRLDARRPEDARIMRMIRNGISLIAAHTNMDGAAGGINDHLAARLGLRDIRVLEETAAPYLKVAVFVPESHAEAVMDAAFSAGAGRIGNYARCAFYAKGTGTFLPGEGTAPYVGRPGALEKTAETRAECICCERDLQNVLEGIRKAHPYEEPAIDVYALHAPRGAKGTARIGDLDRPYEREELAALIRQTLGIPCLRVSGKGPTRVQRIAVCGGSGGAALCAARENGAQALLTGELKHSDYIGENDMLLIEAGHFDTEVCFCHIVFEGLQQRLNALKWYVNVWMAETSRPYEIM